MRKFIAAAAIATVAILPMSAHAQQAAPAAPAQQEKGFDTTKALVIVGGAVVGAAVIGSPMSVRGATLLGAAIGAYLANWWYSEHSATPALDPTKKAL